MMMVKLYDSPFHATEDSPEEAANMVLRADLMIFIRNIIESHGWTQAKTGEMLGIPQPRVSDLLTGKIDKFGLDKLICYIAALGFKPTFNTSTGASAPTIKFEEKVA